jgi:uncharacterized repeat protein (TIGR03803 family)
VLYGTTLYGGMDGSGTIFKMNKDGTSYAILHNFDVPTGDGVVPKAPLVEGSDGVLYGTAVGGGSNLGGTVFKINTDGTGYAELHSFSGTGVEGQSPRTPLVEASDGTLHGSTSRGGGNGVGTRFQMNKDGSGFVVLGNFGSDGEDRKYPQAPVEGSDGVLYGTTTYEGSYVSGTVFKVNKDGSGRAALYSFSGTDGDGQWPLATVVEGSDGVLYGNTSHGGGANIGTVFRIVRPGV